jgi:hypothetical protein
MQLVSIEATSKNWCTSTTIVEGSWAGAALVVGCWWVVPEATGASLVVVASITGCLA